MYLLKPMCKDKIVFLLESALLSGIRNTRVSVALLVFVCIFVFRFSFQVFVITVFGVFAIGLTSMRPVSEPVCTPFANLHWENIKRLMKRQKTTKKTSNRNANNGNIGKKTAIHMSY